MDFEAILHLVLLFFLGTLGISLLALLIIFIAAMIRGSLTAPWKFEGREDTPLRRIAGDPGPLPSDDELINALKQMVPRLRRRRLRPNVESAEWQRPHSPATPDQLAATEKKIGQPLPDLLRRIYSEVGNGGFGPAYGLVGVEGGAQDDLGHDLAALHQSYSRDAESEGWPKGLLPVIHLGCAMYLCIDLDQEDSPILLCDPNSDPPEGENDLRVISPSLRQLFTEWLEGRSMKLL